jgi:hypothetical protein
MHHFQEDTNLTLDFLVVTKLFRKGTQKYNTDKYNLSHTKSNVFLIYFYIFLHDELKYAVRTDLSPTAFVLQNFLNLNKF